MAVFRQMRAVVEFATLKQNAANSGGTWKFASPPKMPIDSGFGVVAIRNKGLKGEPVPKAGLVAASNVALRDIAAMSAHKAEDQLINGVPYVVRRQGAEALAKHIEYPDHNSVRFDLPCNTGPKGSGKTVLQCQNMLQVARDFGFLAVEIEFNGIQTVEYENKPSFARLVANQILSYLPKNQGLDWTELHESEADFTRRVAKRILCYLPKYQGLDWSKCLKAITKDFDGKDESPLDDVTRAVEELKKALNHEGPVLLAVDELAMAPGNKKHNLSTLCRIMDQSLHLSADKRIFLAVSVYSLVDLGALATESSRDLVHQELPPILPMLLDSDVLTRSPDWLQVFFSKEKREEMKLKLTSDMGGVPKLLAESGGHPRRIEALIEEVDEISSRVLENAERTAKRNKTTFKESEVLPSLLQSVDTWKKEGLMAMNKKINLRAIGESLSSFVKSEKCGDVYGGVWNAVLVLLKLRRAPSVMDIDMDRVSLVLLKYLFTTVDIDHPDAKILRRATILHYQLVPRGERHVGYLPLPALQQFCVQLLGKSSNKKVRSFLEHAQGVADANLSFTSDTPAKERTKHFEMGMFHALCGAALAEAGLTEGRFRRSPDNLPQTRCTEIEWAEDIQLFPNAVEKGTLRVCDDKTLRRISQVGAFDAQKEEKSFKGLAFVPTDERNTCCDFVLVLPTAGRTAGRVVFAVQCKHYVEDVAAAGRGLQALAQLREIVDQSKDTRVVFVLATVNEVPQTCEESVLQRLNLPDEVKYTSTKLQEDEGLMDLQHMCDWCPTVGYGALLAEKLREFPI